MMATKVFVYGTLKQGFVNEPLLADQTFRGKAVLTDARYRLYEIQGNFQFPALVEVDENGYQVYGELYEVSQACLEYLDQLEGVKYGLYDRIYVKVLLTDGRLEEKVIAYRFLNSTKDCRHVGAVWPVRNLAAFSFADKQLREFDVEIEIEGFCLWNKVAKAFVTPIFTSTKELEKFCKPRCMKLGAKQPNECWSPLAFEAKSHKGKTKQHRFELLSETECNSPAFDNKYELCEWASKNLTFFGGIKGNANEWRKVLSDVSPIYDDK